MRVYQFHHSGASRSLSRHPAPPTFDGVTFRTTCADNPQMTFRRSLALLVVGTLAGVACTRASATPSAPSPTIAASSPAPVSVAAQAADPGPVLPDGRFVARSNTKWLTIWRGPSEEAGKRYAFLTKNPVGQDLEFLVTTTARDQDGGAWLRILLPIRPNGAAGWVRMGAVKRPRGRPADRRRSLGQDAAVLPRRPSGA